MRARQAHMRPIIDIDRLLNASLLLGDRGSQFSRWRSENILQEDVGHYKITINFPQPLSFFTQGYDFC